MNEIEWGRFQPRLPSSSFCVLLSYTHLPHSLLETVVWNEEVGYVCIRTNHVCRYPYKDGKE